MLKIERTFSFWIFSERALFPPKKGRERKDADVKEWFYLLYQFDDLNSEAQQLVYRSFYTFVYRDIYYLVKDHPITEDLIQESFFKVISAVKKHEVLKILPWIRQIVRNLTLDYLKKVYKERNVTSINDVNIIESKLGSGIESLSVDKEIENKVRDELLHEAIAELKPDYRLLITLFYINELSGKEIAAILDLSEQAVSQKLLRARKKLFQQFQRKWDKL